MAERHITFLQIGNRRYYNRKKSRVLHNIPEEPCPRKVQSILAASTVTTEVTAEEHHQSLSLLTNLSATEMHKRWQAHERSFPSCHLCW